MDVQVYFSKVEDPRVVGRCKHKLSDILVSRPLKSVDKREVIHP